MKTAGLRLIGLGFLGLATLFSVVAAWQAACGAEYGRVAASGLFAVSIRLTIAGVEPWPRRLALCALLSAAVWLGFSVAGGVISGGRKEEAGPIALTVLFGLYLGLPILVLTSLLSLIVVRRAGRPVL